MEPEKRLGWKWFEFIKYVKMPVTILIYGIITIVFLIEVITDFSGYILVYELLFIIIFAISIIVLYGMYKMKKYFLFLYFIEYIFYFIISIGFFKKSVFNVLVTFVVLLCEIYYFSKRGDYFN